MMGRPLIWVSGVTILLIACGGLGFATSPTATPLPTLSALPLPSDTPHPTVTPILFPTYSPTVPPSETPLPTLTFTPTLTPEPQPVFQGPGEIVVPILLYHHIGFSLQGETVYYISPENFDRQMNLLYQWGYKTISVELLVRAIREGAVLPPKPVILTFDDGSESTYAAALPILQRYSFTGVSYIVLNYVGIPRYMNVEQIRSLHASGWEIGSHGLSHADLTARPGRQEDEIVESRRRLERLLGVPVLSFAYPFGAYDDTSLQNVHSAGYIAAMGLGNETVQSSKNLFYLSRRPIRGTDDLKSFSLFLPWRQEQYDLPPITIVP